MHHMQKDGVNGLKYLQTTHSGMIPQLGNHGDGLHRALLTVTNTKKISESQKITTQSDDSHSRSHGQLPTVHWSDSCFVSQPVLDP